MINWNFPDFKRSEFECKCGCNLLDYYESNYQGIVLYFLQPLRSHIKKPVNITSGIRCFNHNKNIGGSSLSYHCNYGKNKSRRPSAVDFWVDDMSVNEIDLYIQMHISTEFCGYKIYIRPDNTWLVHIDFRGYKARW